MFRGVEAHRSHSGISARYRSLLTATVSASDYYYTGSESPQRANARRHGWIGWLRHLKVCGRSFSRIWLDVERKIKLFWGVETSVSEQKGDETSANRGQKLRHPQRCQVRVRRRGSQRPPKSNTVRSQKAQSTKAYNYEQDNGEARGCSAPHFKLYGVILAIPTLMIVHLSISNSASSGARASSSREKRTRLVLGSSNDGTVAAGLRHTFNILPSLPVEQDA